MRSPIFSSKIVMPVLWAWSVRSVCMPEFRKNSVSIDGNWICRFRKRRWEYDTIRNSFDCSRFSRNHYSCFHRLHFVGAWKKRPRKVNLARDCFVDRLWSNKSEPAALTKGRFFLHLQYSTHFFPINRLPFFLSCSPILYKKTTTKSDLWQDCFVSCLWNNKSEPAALTKGRFFLHLQYSTRFYTLILYFSTKNISISKRGWFGRFVCRSSEKTPFR